MAGEQSTMIAAPVGTLVVVVTSGCGTKAALHLLLNECAQGGFAA
jgi:hypothetical protein